MSNNATYLRNQQIRRAGVWVSDTWNNLMDSLGLSSVAQKSFYLILVIVGLYFLIKIINEKARSRYLWSMQNQPVFLKQIEDNKKPYSGLQEFTFSDKNNKNVNYIPYQYFTMQNGNNYTFGYWLKINSKDFAKTYGSGNQGVRHIWNRGPQPQPGNNNSSIMSAPSITLHESKNVMLIQFAPNQGEEPYVIRVRVPMDKWISYFIVVSENVVELYINGRLEITRVFSNMKKDVIGNIFVGGEKSTGINYGFPGNLGFLMFFPVNKSQHDIYQTYKLYQKLITNYEDGIKNKTDSSKDDCPDCPQQPLQPPFQPGPVIPQELTSKISNLKKKFL